MEVKIEQLIQQITEQEEINKTKDQTITVLENKFKVVSELFESEKQTNAKLRTEIATLTASLQKVKVEQTEESKRVTQLTLTVSSLRSACEKMKEHENEELEKLEEKRKWFVETMNEINNELRTNFKEKAESEN